MQNILKCLYIGAYSLFSWVCYFLCYCFEVLELFYFVVLCPSPVLFYTSFLCPSPSACLDCLARPDLFHLCLVNLPFFVYFSLHEALFAFQFVVLPSMASFLLFFLCFWFCFLDLFYISGGVGGWELCFFSWTIQICLVDWTFVPSFDLRSYRHPVCIKPLCQWTSVSPNKRLSYRKNFTLHSWVHLWKSCINLSNDT